MSLIVPVYQNEHNMNSSDSNETVNRQIAFMQIDSEVIDTKLFHMSTDDIPSDYMKILNQDNVFN